MKIVIYTGEDCPSCLPVERKVIPHLKSHGYEVEHIHLLKQADPPSGVMGLPTIFFVDYDGHQVHQMTGRITLQAVLDKYAELVHVQPST